MLILPWLAQQTTSYMLSSHDWAKEHSYNAAVMPPLFRWSLHMCIAQSILWTSEYLVMHLQECYKWSQLLHKPPDAHVQGYKWSQLLHSHYLQNVGRESLTTPSWLICSLPTISYHFPTPTLHPGFHQFTEAM